MATLSYVIDDIDYARSFVNSLPRKIVRARFSTNSEWDPKHIVIVLRNDTPIAMADCIVTFDRRSANGSLLAAPNCGAYAIHALIKLKAHASIEHWESTLRLPTKSTIAISRRFFDSTFDQGTWEISNGMVENLGPNPLFAPTPIIMNDSLLSFLGIPKLQLLDTQSISQILYAASNRDRVKILSPNGLVMDNPSLMALTFEVLNLTMSLRQNITRTILVNAMQTQGLPITDKTRKRFKSDMESFNSYFSELLKFRNIDSPQTGSFVIENW